MEIKSYKYKRGIKLLSQSPYTVVDGTETLGLPKYVFVSLKQAKGALPLVMVEVGEEVYVGSILAKGRTTVVLSPVTGKVVAIEKRPSVFGGSCDHVIIETNSEEAFFRLPDLIEEELTPDQILKRIYDCGIVNNDGVPLYKKLTVEEDEIVDSIVINACTDEPYINSTAFLFNTMPNDVIRGIEYIVQCLGANFVKIAMTDSVCTQLNPFLEVLRNYDGMIRFEVSKVGDKYPVGDENELVYALSDSRKHIKQNKKSKLVVIDAGCCLPVFQAITRGVCDDYKLITVVGVGELYNEQKNIWVKVGTTIGEIVNQTRQGYSDNITKIVVGGPMRGVAVSGLDCSITKTTKGVMFLSGMENALNLESDCIGCGKCSEVCPKRLLPYKLDELSQDEDYDGCKRFGVEYCTKCGCCSYVCPTKRYLVQRISYAKDVIEGKGGERI